MLSSSARAWILLCSWLLCSSSCCCSAGHGVPGCPHVLHRMRMHWLHLFILAPLFLLIPQVAH